MDSKTRRAHGIASLPGSLEEAVALMEANSMVREVLGDGISLADFEILEWIRGYLEEAYLKIQ